MVYTTDDYRPSHRQIRILDLLPGDSGEAIRCLVRIASLDGDEQYEALSYVWGEAGAQKEIEVSGQTVHVTDNLYAALHRLRYPMQKRTIWIDQLCINQSDNLERSSQVAMMRDIYKRCSCCIIWLGELEAVPSKDASAVFTFLKEVAAVATTPYMGLPTLFRDTPDGATARRAFTAFAMYGNPWWSRIWTVQEAMIPHDAVLVWGHLSVSRADVLATSRHLRSDLMHAHFPDTFKAKRVQHYEMLRRMLYPVHGFIHSSTHDGPLDLLLRWRHRDASNPRDKVYALMGLLPDDVLPSARTYDYEAPPSLLFANVTFALIQLENGLRPLLGSSEMPHRTSGLPTWAIDFANTNRLGMRQLKWWNHSHRYRQFSTCGSQTLQASLLDEGRILSLAGSFIDVIDVCSEVYDVPDNVPILSSRLHETTNDWEKLIEQWRKSHAFNWVYKTGETWEVACLRTTLGDLVMAEYPVERVKLAHLESLIKLWDSPHGNTQGLLAEPKHGTDPNQRFFMTNGGYMGVGPPVTRNKEYGTLYESTCGMVPNQTFFITKKGYMGVGPPDTRPGDQVWVLYGGQVPFILRDTTRGANGEQLKKGTLVGDAYVHGVMDGEALQHNPEARTVHLS
jgi:hypothetical protein